MLTLSKWCRHSASKRMLVPQEGVSCAVSQPGSAMGASEERSGERPEGRLCWQSQPQEIVRVTQSELSGSPNAWWAGQDRLSRTENKGVVFLSLPTDFYLYSVFQSSYQKHLLRNTNGADSFDSSVATHPSEHQVHLPWCFPLVNGRCVAKFPLPSLSPSLCLPPSLSCFPW